MNQRTNKLANVRAYILVVINLCWSSFTYASDLSEKLTSTEYVLLMRHARAPGVGDPANYTLKDCQTQRNLSPEGRKQAIGIGNWLRKQNINQAHVFSSQWCRCKDTAQLLGFGQYKVEPSLASFFDEMHKAKERNTHLQSLIAEKLNAKGKNALILVTHHVNIFEYMGENIASGDMVLAKVDSNGRLLSYKVIPRPN